MPDDTHSNSGFGPKAPIDGGSLSVQDALVVVAIRLIGSDIRRNPSARRHIIALARSTPLLMDDDYGATERRIKQLAGLAGTAEMNDLFARALERLRDGYRKEALRWAAVAGRVAS